VCVLGGFRDEIYISTLLHLKDYRKILAKTSG